MLKDFDKKKNPFKVPADYFESFHSDIMNKIDEMPVEAVKPVKKVSLWRRYSLIGSAVAAVAVLALVFVNSWSDDMLNEKESDLYEVDAEYYSFIESELTDFEVEEFYYDELD